jgi:hypothetical protein
LKPQPATATGASWASASWAAFCVVDTSSQQGEAANLQKWREIGEVERKMRTCTWAKH